MFNIDPRRLDSYRRVLPAGLVPALTAGVRRETRKTSLADGWKSANGTSNLHANCRSTTRRWTEAESGQVRGGVRHG